MTNFKQYFDHIQSEAYSPDLLIRDLDKAANDDSETMMEYMKKAATSYNKMVESTGISKENLINMEYLEKTSYPNTMRSIILKKLQNK